MFIVWALFRGTFSEVGVNHARTHFGHASDAATTTTVVAAAVRVNIICTGRVG